MNMKPMLLVLALLAIGLVAGSKVAVAAPACMQCLLSAPNPMMLTISDNDAARERFRRQQIRKCCAKYKAGLPLRGQWCSIEIVVRSYERNLCQ